MDETHILLTEFFRKEQNKLQLQLKEAIRLREIWEQSATTLQEWVFWSAGENKKLREENQMLREKLVEMISREGTSK